MDAKKGYLSKLTKEIHNSEARKNIMDEYEAHIDDCKEALMESGMSEQEAEEEAVRQMGDPVDTGREINRIYRNTIDWGMILWYVGLCAVFVCIKAIVLRIGDEVIANNFYTPYWLAVYIGGFFGIYGLILSAVEKYNDWPLFYSYGRDWNGGYFTNSGVILMLAVAFLGKDAKTTAFWIIVFCIIQTIERAYVTLCKNKREAELLWEIGIADTAITYKGAGNICGKKRKVMAQGAQEGATIPEGAPIMVVALDGFKAVVVQV